jgi:cytochrome c551/c552
MKTRQILLILITFTSSFVYANPPVEEGKTIFQSRCASCHNVNKTLTGPALAGVHDRHSTDWIISFVRSSQSMVNSGDQEAVALFEKFNKIPMPDHSDLTDENIKSILEYIKTEGKTAATETAPFARPSKRRPAYVPLNTADYLYFIALLGAIVLLIASLLFAVKVREYKRRYLKI